MLNRPVALRAFLSFRAWLAKIVPDLPGLRGLLPARCDVSCGAAGTMADWRDETYTRCPPEFSRRSAVLRRGAAFPRACRRPGRTCPCRRRPGDARCAGGGGCKGLGAGAGPCTTGRRPRRDCMAMAAGGRGLSRRLRKLSEAATRLAGPVVVASEGRSGRDAVIHPVAGDRLFREGRAVDSRRGHCVGAGAGGGRAKGPGGGRGSQGLDRSALRGRGRRRIAGAARGGSGESARGAARCAAMGGPFGRGAADVAASLGRLAGAGKGTNRAACNVRRRKRIDSCRAAGFGGQCGSGL